MEERKENIKYNYTIKGTINTEFYIKKKKAAAFSH